MTQARRFTSKVAYAPETTWGTAVNPATAMPVNDIKESPTYERIIDQGFRGIGARDFRSQQGVGHGELQIGGFLYPEEGGALLNAMMGSEVKTGSGPYVHTLSMANTPASYTIESDVNGGTNGALRFAGCKLGQLALSFNAAQGALSYSSTWMSKIPTKVTAQNPSLAPENAPWEAWRAAIASTGFTSNVISADLTLERELQGVWTAQNTQDPFAINQGPLAVSGKIVVAATALTIFDTWKSFTNQSFVVTFTYGSGASEKTLVITLTSANLADGPFEIDRGAIGVTFGFPFLGLYNSTDVGPCVVALTNSKSTVY